MQEQGPPLPAFPHLPCCCAASLAFLPHYKGPVLVEALARERVWLSSDIGSHPDQLRKAFPDPRCAVGGMLCSARTFTAHVG